MSEQERGLRKGQHLSGIHAKEVERIRRALEVSGLERSAIRQMVERQQLEMERIATVVGNQSFAAEAAAAFSASSSAVRAQHEAVERALTTVRALEAYQRVELPTETLTGIAAAARAVRDLDGLAGGIAGLAKQIDISPVVSEELRQRLDIGFAGLKVSHTELEAASGSMRAASSLYQPVFESISRLQVSIASLECSGVYEDTEPGPTARPCPFEDDAVVIGPSEDEPRGGSVIERVPRGRLIQVVPADLTEFMHVVQDPGRMRTMGGHAFEEFVARVLDGMGFKDVQLTRRSGDAGIDIWAVREVDGMAQVWACQCKQTKNAIGPEVGRALLGSISLPGNQATVGLIATTSTFTRGSKAEMVEHPQLHGLDGDGIAQWVAKTLRLRGLLPPEA